MLTVRTILNIYKTYSMKWLGQ